MPPANPGAPLFARARSYAHAPPIHPHSRHAVCCAGAGSGPFLPSNLRAYGRQACGRMGAANVQEKGVSYAEQGTFSLASWPFSLKLLWAPLVRTP